jgi:Predicted membrane protein (DUF2142)
VHHPGNRGVPGLRAPRATGVRRALLAGLGLTLFLISFAGANPGGAVSDEPDQYVKAIAAGRLDLVGTKVTTQQARSMDSWIPVINLILTHVPAFAQLARAYHIPASLDPRYLGCTIQDTQASCLDRQPPRSASRTETIVSSVGTYQPFIFVPAGLVMRLATSTTAALLLGRLTFTLLAALLLMGALLVALRARPGPVSVCSIALCVAPTSVLVMSAISTSGAESAAGIAWWVALLAATEPKAQRAAWWLALAAGLVLAVARTTGPVWMLVIALVVLVFRGRRVAWRTFRSGAKLAIATVAVCVAAGVVTLAWQLTVQPASLESPAATLGRATPSMIGFILNRALGTYGWGEAAPPEVLIQIWALMIAALVLLGLASAVVRRSGREIAALVLTCAVDVAAIALFLAFGSHAGQVQGRWFIAPLAGIPILAGWMAATQPGTAAFARISRIVASVLVAGVGACLALSWWLNEYRYTVHSGGPLFFLGHSLWQPPLGWAPWIVCGILGLVALVLSGLPGRAATEAATLSDPG